MNIKQVKYVLSVYDGRSFSAAAREQGVSVQAVSKAVSDLERESDSRLFDRTGRGVVPTAMGEEFCRRAREVVLAFEELEAFARSGGDPEPGAPLRLVLCAPHFLGADQILQTMRGIVQRGTGIDASFLVEAPSVALAEYSRGECDALLTIGRYDGPAMDCRSIGSMPTGIVVRRGHPLAEAGGSVHVSDLASYPVNMSPELDGFNDSIMVMYQRRGVLGEVESIDTDEQLAEFLGARDGYYFTAMVPIADPEGSMMVRLPIDPAEGLVVPICLVTSKGRQNPRVSRVYEYLHDLLAKLASGKGSPS